MIRYIHQLPDWTIAIHMKSFIYESIDIAADFDLYVAAGAKTLSSALRARRQTF